MAKVKADIANLHESSPDNSADGEYMHLIKGEESFGSDKPELLVPHHWAVTPLELSENYKDTSSVTYKFVPCEAGATTNMQASPAHDTTYYVISNPGEVFGTQGTNKTIKRKVAETKAVNRSTAKKRDDKRRKTHNEVERRRRDKINTWIMNLAALVPNSGAPDFASKGGILAKACDHITELTEKQKRLEKLEVDNEKLVLEVLRLNQELSEVRKENSLMRHQTADNCIVYTTNKGQKP